VLLCVPPSRGSPYPPSVTLWSGLNKVLLKGDISRKMKRIPFLGRQI
jgi:hypothetical protein